MVRDRFDVNTDHMSAQKQIMKLSPDIIAAYEEILAIFDDMCEIIVGCITPVADINDLLPVPARGIDYLAESAVFVAFPAGLDDKVCKTRVEDGEKGIYMDLAKFPGGFSIWLKESIRIIRVPVNVQRGTIAGDELILVLEKPFF